VSNSVSYFSRGMTTRMEDDGSHFVGLATSPAPLWALKSTQEFHDELEASRHRTWKSFVARIFFEYQTDLPEWRPASAGALEHLPSLVSDIVICRAETG